MTPPWRGQGVELVESPEPYEEEDTDKGVEELSVRASQEEDEDEESEKLDLVSGGLVKIMNMLDKGYRARAVQMKVTINLQLNLCL